MCQHGIFDIRALKIKIKVKVTSLGISFSPSSKNTPSSPPYCVGSKKKELPEEKSNQELPADIADDSSCYTLVFDEDLNMADTIGGNFHMNNHTLSQKYRDPIMVM